MFPIFADALGYFISKDESRHLFSGFKVGKDVAVSHLQCADDTILLLDAKVSSVWNLKMIIRCFEVPDLKSAGARVFGRDWISEC